MTCTVKEDTLTDMVSCMSETTGLVHQMPFVCDRDGFSGVLEKVIFKYFFNFQNLFSPILVADTCPFTTLTLRLGNGSGI